MRCPNDLELQSYGDFELAPGRARRVRRHLADCPACRLQLERQTSMVQLLQRTMPTPAVPKPTPARSYFPMTNRWVWAAAASLVLLISSGVLFTRIQATRWTPETEILNQYVNLYQEGPTVLMNYNF